MFPTRLLPWIIPGRKMTPGTRTNHGPIRPHTRTCASLNPYESHTKQHTIQSPSLFSRPHSVKNAIFFALSIIIHVSSPSFSFSSPPVYLRTGNAPSLPLPLVSEPTHPTHPTPSLPMSTPKRRPHRISPEKREHTTPPPPPSPSLQSTL